MIVCHCFCVSDREIRTCVRQGASDANSVERVCGAGGGCGGCRPEVENVVRSEKLKLRSEHSSPGQSLLALVQLHAAG